MHKFAMIFEEKVWTENFTDFHSNKQNDVKLLEGRTKGKSKLVMYIQTALGGTYARMYGTCVPL